MSTRLRRPSSFHAPRPTSSCPLRRSLPLRPRALPRSLLAARSLLLPPGTACRAMASCMVRLSPSLVRSSCPLRPLMAATPLPFPRVSMARATSFSLLVLRLSMMTQRWQLALWRSITLLSFRQRLRKWCRPLFNGIHPSYMRKERLDLPATQGLGSESSQLRGFNSVSYPPGSIDQN
jgi:hypothetical protein